MEESAQQQQRKLVPPKLKLDLSGLKQSEHTNNPSPGSAGGTHPHLPSATSPSGQHNGIPSLKMSSGQGQGLGPGIAQGHGPEDTSSPKNTTSPRFLSFAGTEAIVNNKLHNSQSHSDNSDHSKVDSNSKNSSRTGSILSVATGSNSRHHSMLKVDTNTSPLPGLGAIAEASVGSSGSLGESSTASAHAYNEQPPVGGPVGVPGGLGGVPR